jgi:hypothetical protein
MKTKTALTEGLIRKGILYLEAGGTDRFKCSLGVINL